MAVLRSPGRKLGEYRLLGRIGRGAMGEVWEATQESLGRRVALKILPDEFSQDENSVERFRRESKAAAKLQHRHIVSVYGVGEEAGTHYYAMEFVKGRSLKDILAEGKLEPRRLGKWGIQVAEALEYAHKAGVIHRDIKPANIMIREDGEDAALADFGLARADDARSITRSGVLLGTPLYMAPEQALGSAMDSRTDVWQLGITLYESLAGNPPFDGNDLRELIVQITSKDPPPIPRAPWELEAIVGKALAKKPEERYQSAREFKEDLIRFMRGEVILAAKTPLALRVGKTWKRQRAVFSVVLVALLSLVPVSLWSAHRAATKAEAKLKDAMALELSVRDAQRAREDEERARATELRSREEAAARELAAGLALAGGSLDEWRRHSDVLAKRIAFRAETLLQGDSGRLDVAKKNVETEREAVCSEEEKLAELSGEALAKLDAACAVATPGGETAQRARAFAGDLLRALLHWARRHGEDRLALVYERDQRRFGVVAAVSSSSLLSIRTSPPGARARLVRLHEEDGFRFEGPTSEIGTTPLDDHPRRGLAVVELDMEGFAPSRVPVSIDERTSVAVRFWAKEKVPAGFVHVPASELEPVHDSRAVRAREQSRPLWVDDFLISRDEVTVGEWLEFVNAAPPSERLARTPAREQFSMGSDGRYVPAPGRTGEDPARYPAAGISFDLAEAYARWRSARDGFAFRLPTEEEWEKAAGACFASGFPWGPRFTGKEANVGCDPEPGRVPVRPVGSYSGDRSIYGVNDLAGNVSEWTSSVFSPGIRVVKGGSFARSSEPVRIFSREPVDSAQFQATRERFGVRLVVGR